MTTTFTTPEHALEYVSTHLQNVDLDACKFISAWITCKPGKRDAQTLTEVFQAFLEEADSHHITLSDVLESDRFDIDSNDDDESDEYALRLEKSLHRLGLVLPESEYDDDE
jgi:hypothetical protein